jgi:hypothetical protein
MFGRSEMKFQIPNPKSQRSSKLQIPKDQRIMRRPLELGAWDFFGAWDLGFGIFLP